MFWAFIIIVIFLVIAAYSGVDIPKMLAAETLAFIVFAIIFFTTYSQTALYAYGAWILGRIICWAVKTIAY